MKIIPVALLLLAYFTTLDAGAQVRRKKQVYKKPKMPETPPALTQWPGSSDKNDNAPDKNYGEKPAPSVPASNFDYEKFKEEMRITDSLLKATNVFQTADSMATIVLQHYEDTCRRKDPLHKGLSSTYYEHYAQQISINPYKGIWHIWYFFNDDLYHKGETNPPVHHLPKVFPYHFEITIDRNKGTAVLEKKVFDPYYKPSKGISGF